MLLNSVSAFPCNDAADLGRASRVERLDTLRASSQLSLDIVQGCQRIAALLRSACCGRECPQGLRVKRKQFRRAA